MSAFPPGSQARGFVEADPLLTPSLQSFTEKQHFRQKPWRLQSQIWVALFGGVWAVSVIAYMNGLHLGVSDRQLRQIGLIALVGTVATLLTTLLIGEWATTIGIQRESQVLRLASRAVALLAYLALVRVQKSADRVYQYASDGEYESLWRSGLLAVFGVGFLQNIFVTLILRWLEGAGYL